MSGLRGVLDEMVVKNERGNDSFDETRDAIKNGGEEW